MNKLLRFFLKSQFILNQAEQGHFHKVSVYTRSFFSLGRGCFEVHS